ncbi:hypothetical protein ACFW34_11955 [Streptomyces sp. NPDC058848]|uniref:hypothetical protein n=1 Tax=unclassified Streptomyces TaxID=2593676 RepID=UPI0036C436D7
MTDRHTVDSITSDQLDALYERVAKAEHEAEVSVAAAAQLTTLVGKRSEKAEKAAKSQRQRAKIAETELRVLRAGLRANGADPTQIQNLWAQISLRNRQWRDEKRRAELAEAVTAEWKRHLERRTTTLRKRAERAEAAIGRVRALHQPAQGLGYDSDEDDTPGSYGQIAQACTTCGTTDEYAVRWPCDTIRALDESSVPAATEVTEPEDEWTGPLVPPILTEAIRQHDAETERAVAALAQAYGPTADLDHPQHPVNAVPHRITVAPRDFEAEQPADQSTEK